MSGDDLLALGSSTNCMSPPRANLHQNIGKQRTTSMIFHIQVRVRCENFKYKSIQVLKTPSFGIGKSDSLIHNTKITPYNLSRLSFRELGPELYLI
jgi:hypothetical protein